MTDGFARRKEQSKKEIRKAAFELFGQFGIEKASIADISRKAGVSQATIYNNFGSKDALVREFVAAAIDQLVKGVQEVLAPNKPYWEKMDDMIQFISGMMAQGRASGNFHLNTPVYSSGYDLLNDPEIEKIRAAAQEQMISLLLGFVAEGKKQGHIRMDLTDDAFRIYFQALMDVFVDPHFKQLYHLDHRLVHELGSLMIYGLKGHN